MKKPLPIGIDDFKKLRDNDFYYTDKTLFIKELLDKRSEVSLFTRPRRFGKTLELSMLKYFFESVHVPDGCSGVVCGRIAVNEGQQLLYFFFDHWKTLHGFIGLDAPILLLRFALCNSRPCGRGRICFTLRGFYSILFLLVNIESTGKAGTRLWNAVIRAIRRMWKY